MAKRKTTKNKVHHTVTLAEFLSVVYDVAFEESHNQAISERIASSFLIRTLRKRSASSKH